MQPHPRSLAPPWSHFPPWILQPPSGLRPEPALDLWGWSTGLLQLLVPTRRPGPVCTFLSTFSRHGMESGPLSPRRHQGRSGRGGKPQRGPLDFRPQSGQGLEKHTAGRVGPATGNSALARLLQVFVLKHPRAPEDGAQCIGTLQGAPAPRCPEKHRPQGPSEPPEPGMETVGEASPRSPGPVGSGRPGLQGPLEPGFGAGGLPC